MVLGLRTKTLKTPSLHLNYLIHIDEVKPWPPSPSLRTLRAVLIEWEQGERASGFTNQVVPGDGRIQFNQSFGLKLSLDQSKRIHFNLYEPGRNKRGQLLGSAVLDLGAIKENMSITTPIQCKRTHRNSVQPLLFLKIHPVEASRQESVSALMSEEYAEEAETASFTTDDDVSSHSSLPLTAATSSSLNSKLQNAKVAVNGSGRGSKVVRVPHQPDEEQATESSSMDSSSDIAWISKRIKSHSLQSYVVKESDKWQSSSTIINEHPKEEEGSVVTGKRDVKNRSTTEQSISTLSKASRAEVDHKIDKHLLVAGRTHYPQSGCMDNEAREGHKAYVEEEVQEFENLVLNEYPQVDMQKQMTLKNGTASSTEVSVPSLNSFSSIRKHSLVTDTSRGLNAKAFRKEIGNLGRVQQLEHRVKILEGELREAAGLEVGIYSVVAEHGSSMNKVHAPARRLSRLYFNANKHNRKSGRASASKSVVSGLVIIAKACGNDVPRLTFWLSNTIVLRAIISKSFGESRIRGKASEENGKKKSSPLTWHSVGDKGDHVAFLAALEKAEAWIFSRIIESLWWQSFTPHMQTGASKAIRTSIGCNSSKLYRRTSSWSAEQQGNFSMELWKKALRDACKRICPVRGGGHGHDCGCLPMLSKLIMEQLVARLDVAMLNAVLRESADEIPTDPVADPISDASVLPIPAGKLSFGAGAQLKNVIGSWSRWVSDLFGMDEDEDRNNSSKSAFLLLNALSDLMMLPKDMLFNSSIRKEVCPAFSLPLLIRILNSFVPDEFCPDRVPGALLEALITELDSEEHDSIVNLVPSEAAAVVYKAPSVAAILGGSSPLLNKSQTSDDELNQLHSPLIGKPTSVRYQLLRQLWNQD